MALFSPNENDVFHKSKEGQDLYLDEYLPKKSVKFQRCNYVKSKSKEVQVKSTLGVQGLPCTPSYSRNILT